MTTTCQWPGFSFQLTVWVPRPWAVTAQKRWVAGGAGVRLPVWLANEGPPQPKSWSSLRLTFARYRFTSWLRPIPTNTGRPEDVLEADTRTRRISQSGVNLPTSTLGEVIARPAVSY